MDKIIDIKGLSKSFGDKKVLEDLNLYVRRGEFITITICPTVLKVLMTIGDAVGNMILRMLPVS